MTWRWAGWRKVVYPLGAYVGVLGLWQAMCSVGGWSDDVFPGPVATFAGLIELIAGGTLLQHAVASLFRVTLGFYIAVVTAVPIGIGLGRWAAGRLAFNSLIQFLRPISPLAWIPLAMLWFGIGDKPAVFLIFLSSFFPLLVSTMAAVQQIDQTYFRVAANFAFTRFETVRKVIVPAILPSVLPALRISLGVAWLVVVAAEMIAVKSGLGYLILDSRNALRMDYVLDAMIAIGAIGVVLDRLMGQLESLGGVAWGVQRQ
jgi:NitT/TauT family transport system permease protein